MVDLGISSMGNSTRPQQKLHVEKDGKRTTVVDELGRPKVSVLRDGAKSYVTDYTTGRSHDIEKGDGLYMKNVYNSVSSPSTKIGLMMKDTSEGKRSGIGVKNAKPQNYIERFVYRKWIKEDGGSINFSNYTGHVLDEDLHTYNLLKDPNYTRDKGIVKNSIEKLKQQVDHYMPKFNQYENSLCIDGRYRDLGTTDRHTAKYQNLVLDNYDKKIYTSGFYDATEKPRFTHVYDKKGRFVKEICREGLGTRRISDYIKGVAEYFHKSEGLYERGIVDSQGNNVKLTFRDTPNGKKPLIEVRHQSAAPRSLYDRLTGQPKKAVWSNFTDNLGKVLEGEHSDKDIIKEGVKAFNKYVKQFLKVAK